VADFVNSVDWFGVCILGFCISAVCGFILVRFS
jgi:hypothetical protein